MQKIDIWDEWVEAKDVLAMCDYLFDITLTPRQEDIVRAVAFDTHKKTVISCSTRYGKSFCVSMGVIIYIITHVDKRVLLVAPTYNQTKIIRNYISNFLPMMLQRPEIAPLIPFDAQREERLRREISQSRITFTNGCELMTLSAEGTGQRLMGFGGDLIILDEDCQIPYETYRAYISRMKGDKPDTRMVEIGNPWDRLNQMYAHWTDPNYHTIHIDYRAGLEEGRYSENFIEEQKAELTPMEFKILWEAEFPDEAEDSLFKYAWVKEAMDYEIELPKNAEKVAGLDVAEAGIDKTVLIIGARKGNKYKITDVHVWNKADTMATVGLVRDKIGKKVKLYVDAIGVGKGVYDRLKEEGYSAVEIKVGRAATKDTDRLMNQKSQFYWRLREIFEGGQIEIPENSRLTKELMLMRYELTSSGKIKIIDPHKSPDFADALMLCCADLGGVIIDW